MTSLAFLLYEFESKYEVSSGFICAVPFQGVFGDVHDGVAVWVPEHSDGAEHDGAAAYRHGDDDGGHRRHKQGKCAETSDDNEASGYDAWDADDAVSYLMLHWQ